MLGQQEYLGRTEAEAQHVVEEEVVQLVRSYEVFRLLGNVAFLVGRRQLRRYGRLDNVYQCIFLGLELRQGGNIAHHILDERLGHTTVDTIHRHVVAIIGGPAQRQFGEVASTHHQCVELVGEVHEYLCTLSGLRILVGGVMGFHIVADILEMLLHGLGDGDFHLRDAQLLHQGDSILVGAVAGAEAWHGDTHNTLAVVAQLIEGPDTHQQSQRRVQTTANAYDHVLTVGVQQALGQSRHLDIKDFLAGLGHAVVGRNKGMGIDGTLEGEGMVADGLAGYDSGLRVALGVDERRVGVALSTQALHINLGRLQLWLEGVALALDELRAILENHGVATIDKVLRRLAKTTRAIDIATHGSGTLLGQQGAQILVLADELVAGGAVENNLCASHREVVAGRNGCPDVLANLHAKLHLVRRLEDNGLGRQQHGRAGEVDLRRIEVLGRGKPALLIELVVVGQIGLGHDTQNGATLDDCSTVEQQTTRLYGQAHHADDIQLARELQQSQEAFLGLVQQQLLLEQILTGIARQRELREA